MEICVPPLLEGAGGGPTKRDLGCIDTPEVSFYAEITHFPSVYCRSDEIQLYNITTFGKFKVSEFNKNVEISIIDSNYYNNYNYYNN